MQINKINFQDENNLVNYISHLVKGDISHANYEENVSQASQMSVHLNGDSPRELLESYRPNEPEEVRNYRLESYEPTTESEGKRIVNVLSKTQQTSNYSIVFPEQDNVNEDNSLKKYVTEDYPHFGSVENWAFDLALKQDLIDSNSLVVVMPLVIPDDNVTFLKPYTYIYRSDQVLDYGLNYYTILLDEVNVVKDVELPIWMIVTDKEILKVKRISVTDENRVEIIQLFEFDFDEVPAYFLKGDHRNNANGVAYDSYVSGILPYWNKAIRMDSDLDAQYNQHLFLERVEIEVECDNGCTKDVDSGVMMITSLNNGVESKSACSRCGGNGWINGRSPMGATVVRKDAFEGDGGSEFPGVTYIEKPTEIVELTEKKVDSLISKGYSSINMDIINKVGENQSGIAKTIDRDELFSFLNKFSDNMFDNIIYNAYRFISLWRYSVVDQVTFPIINKPTTFNALSDSVMIEEIKMLSEAGIDTTQFELDLINKKFPNDVEKREFNKNIVELDPLAGKNEEEKLEILMGGGITKESYIVSSNLRDMLLDAIENDADFLEKTRTEKKAILENMAKSKIIKPIESNGNTETNNEPTE